MAKQFKPDLVVDVRSRHGKKLFFYPMRTGLQGDIYPQDLSFGSGSPAIVQQVGYIPGHQIQVDTVNKTAKVIHKMGLPENEQKLEAFKRASRTERYRHVRVNSVEKDQVFNLTDFELRTWLFHISRNLETGRLKLVSGKCPTAEEILLTGRVELCDSNGIQPKDKDRPFYYADERDIGSMEALGAIR